MWKSEKTSEKMSKKIILRVKHEKAIVTKISLMEGRWIDTVTKGVDDSLCQSMVSY